MKFNISKEFLVFIFCGLTVLLIFTLFLKSTYFETFFTWAQAHFVLYVFLIFLIRFMSIAYPPLTGGVFTLASIPIIGWENAFLIDFTGTTLGGIFNYYMGWHYGMKIVTKIMGNEAADKIAKIKFKEGREIEGIIIARIFFGLIMLELIHYACGVFKINFGKYVFAMSVSHVMLAVPLFYLFSKVIVFKDYWYVALSLVVLLPVLYKFRGRYFEI